MKPAPCSASDSLPPTPCLFHVLSRWSPCFKPMRRRGTYARTVKSDQSFRIEARLTHIAPRAARIRPNLNAISVMFAPSFPTEKKTHPFCSKTCAKNSAAQNPLLESNVKGANLELLTGGGIPAFVKDLPTARESLTASIHSSTDSASFRTLLRTHHAVVACFTDQQWSPPCRAIVPVFEKLAEEKGVRAATGGCGAAFTKIDLRVGEGSALASEWSIYVTPAFLFFLDGTKISELKGVDPGELRTQIDQLLFQAYPPHPHSSLPLPAVEALSLAPILFTQVPPLDAVFAKLASFIDAVPPSTSISQAKEVLHAQVAPYLKARFAPADPANPAPQPSATTALLTPWVAATTVLAEVLPIDALFPLVDIWRLAVLDPDAAAWLASSPGATQVGVLVRMARDALAEPTQNKGTRNYVLTALRLLTNTLGHAALARVLLAGTGGKGGVRKAAASLAFNAASRVQRARVAAVAGPGGATIDSADSDGAAAAMDDEWQVQLARALVEALDHEDGEDVVHRLVAALACLLRFAPADGQVGALFMVPGARRVVMGKLERERL
ncbi:hypothetical protein MVEN_01882100 [Mycena venus]|uniref:Thioredoxin domain-containing protein n=1 Tax=Mycena venus TaxID=2733690 RepID=A0A8H6XJA0_9AGAR|nr:hypothetical protein MVEN_01882100 [Mycena venus]